MSSQELAQVDRSNAVALYSDPEAEVEYAARCAKALMRAINSNPQLKVGISGRDYLKVEAWQTLGAMAKVDQIHTVWCREYTPPGAEKPIGWEARVEVVDRDGNVRGSGEAMCVRTERTWASRDEFALRSMAQTRALGKAYRMALSFIVSLAGFETTPAEEMPSNVNAPAAPPPPSPGPPPVVEGTASASGEYVFPVGKHKGKPISQVPREYLDWFLANAGDKPDVQQAIRDHLAPPMDGFTDPEDFPF